MAPKNVKIKKQNGVIFIILTKNKMATQVKTSYSKVKLILKLINKNLGPNTHEY